MMRCIEFYLNTPMFFEALINKVSTGVNAKAAYSISYNPNTGWVQILSEDSASPVDLNAVTSRAKGLSVTGKVNIRMFVKGDEAPMERRREDVIAETADAAAASPSGMLRRLVNYIYKPRLRER